MTTVGEFIKELKAYPKDLEVVTSTGFNGRWKSSKILKGCLNAYSWDGLYTGWEPEDARQSFHLESNVVLKDVIVID